MTAAPRSSRGWYVVAVLAVGAVLAYVDRQVITLLIDPIKQDLGVSDTQVSLLQGLAFAIFHATCALPIARLVDRGHRTRIVAVGCLLWTGATLACGLSDTIGELFVARMLVGVGEAALVPAGFSMIGDLFATRNVPRAAAVFTSASFVGSGTALMVGGPLFDRLTAAAPLSLPLVGAVAPWQATFLTVALPGLIVAPWLLSLREPARRTSAGPVAPAGLGRWLLDHRAALSGLYLGHLLLAFTQFAINAWVPAMFMRNHGWTPGQVGPVYGLFMIVLGCGGTLTGGLLCSRMLARGRLDANYRVSVYAGLAMLPFLVAFPLVDDPRAAFALLAPVAFLGPMPFGGGPAIVSLIAPGHLRAQVIAIYLLLANLFAQGLGPTAVALVTDYGFGDPAAVRYALPIVGTIGTLAGVLATALAMPAVAALIRLRQGDREPAPAMI